MKRHLTLLIVCALLCGCAPAPEASGYTFTDDLGRRVTVESPRRVACLLGSYAQIWQLAGGEVIAAAEDAWEDYGLELPEAVSLGTIKKPSLEALLAAEPDLVLASSATPGQVALQETLEAAGIAVAYFGVQEFADYLHLLKIATDLTGRGDLYEIYGLAVQTQIDAILAEERQPVTVLCLRATSTGVRAKASEGTVLGELLSDLGCVNIADGGVLENLSVEYILERDPAHIFLTPMGDEDRARAAAEAFFAENPLWASLTAVREGRVHFLPKDLYHMKPNARWAEAYAGLEAILDAE